MSFKHKYYEDEEYLLLVIKPTKVFRDFSPRLDY
jgi:hypothetical protein